jgi:exonuclease III
MKNMYSPCNMKIISWNLNHRTIEKPIPDDVVIFFDKYAPDIIALNEYVDGESRNEFKHNLKLSYSRCFSFDISSKYVRPLITKKMD